MKRWVTYGFYSLFAQADKVNWNKIISDLKASNFTGVSMHLLSPWGQHPDEPWFPWPYNPTSKTFNMLKRNLNWYKKLDEVVRLFLSNDMDLEISFFDQYAGENGVHPFINNTIGVRWTDPKPLYDSWVLGSGYTWLAWDDKPLRNFRGVGQIGASLMLYVRSVMDIVSKAMKDIKKGRIAYKRANETRAYMQNGHSLNAKSLGDRDEIARWMAQEWKQRGMVMSQRFLPVVDFGAIAFTEQDYKIAMLGQYNGTLGWPAFFMEIHGVGKQPNSTNGGTLVKDYKYYQNIGMNINLLILSTDGVQVKDGFDLRTRELYNSPATRIDIKQEEASVPYVWSDKDMMGNWNKAFDHHANLVK